MKDLQNLFKRTLPEDYYQWLFPEPPRLTEEEKKEIIQNLSGDDESKRIDSNNKIIDVTFNILQSAIGGVMFQYYRDYTQDHDIKDDIEAFQADPKGHSLDLINNNTQAVIGLSVCMATSIALNLTQHWVKSQNPRSYKIGSEIKNRINNLTPKLLMDGIEEIDNNSENILQLTIPKGLDPRNKKPFAYMMGGSISALSGVSENQQYLVYAASVAMSKFVVDQFDNKIYKPSIIGQTIEKSILDCIPEQCLTSPPSQPSFPIAGKEVADSFLDQDMEELNLQIKKEMLRVLEMKNCKNDSIDLFQKITEAFSFFGIVHQRPGSLIVDDDYVASALDFTIASIAFNISHGFGTILKDHKNPGQVEPLSTNEIELDGIADIENKVLTKPKSNKKDIPATVFSFPKTEEMYKTTSSNRK